MLYSLLRKKFVKEVKDCQWFQDFVSGKNVSAIDEYRKNSAFLSRVPDIIVDVCANILSISTVVISSIDNMAVTLHRPKLSQISSNPPCLAYNADGLGHYGGTKNWLRKIMETKEWKVKILKAIFVYLMKIILVFTIFSNCNISRSCIP